MIKPNQPEPQPSNSPKITQQAETGGRHTHYFKQLLAH